MSSYHAKFSLLIVIVLIVCLSSCTLSTEAVTKVDVGSASSTLGREMATWTGFLRKEKVARKSRKLLEDLVQVDYDYAGPNPKHDPRKGRGGRSL